ncbi:unnamed protein product [Brachionus calyciflorus]|uniref:Uncharacterized protein n=1 Tax=Brachionus calyciflorus TaxID=104777 RepID=A0A814B9N3_9BILA|nr:unnamed protein product [Brachionus calyciflorus]
MRIFEDDFRKKIRSDIFNIQTLSSDILFNDAVKLFVLKYKRFKNAALNDFYHILKMNGLKIIQIKKSLQHKRFGLIEFLNECKNNLINFRSQYRSASLFIRDPDTEEFIKVNNLNCKEYFHEPIPILTENDMKLAYDLNKRDKRIVIIIMEIRIIIMDLILFLEKIK